MSVVMAAAHIGGGVVCLVVGLVFFWIVAKGLAEHRLEVVALVVAMLCSCAATMLFVDLLSHVDVVWTP